MITETDEIPSRKLGVDEMDHAPGAKDNSRWAAPLDVPTEDPEEEDTDMVRVRVVRLLVLSGGARGYNGDGKRG